MRLAALLLLPSLAIVIGPMGAIAGERKVIAPAGATVVGPYSPGILTGDYLYVSGQGARDAKGVLPATPEAQTRQTLENVKAIVEAAGLTLDHAVNVNVYLSDMKNFAAMNGVYSEYFRKDPPARATIEVVRMPTDTPVEITVTLVRDLARKKVIAIPGQQPNPRLSAAIQAGSRVYVSGMQGRDPKTNEFPSDIALQTRRTMDRVDEVLKAAGMGAKNVAYLNIWYAAGVSLAEIEKGLKGRVSPKVARSFIETSELPGGAQVEIGGVAVAKPVFRGNCCVDGDTAFCGLRQGETGAALEALKADLKKAGMDLGGVVSSNVYIDDINNFAAMNKVYASFFGEGKPTRTTVQPTAPAAGKPNRIAVIAVR